MLSNQQGSQALDDVSVAFNVQGGRIQVDLPGQSGEFLVPFSPEAIAQGLEEHAINRATVDPLTTFGATLFNALFTGDRGRVLWEHLDRVTRENRALRLRILTNLERTQHLPWELMFDRSRDDFISLSGRVALVRTRPDGHDRHRTLPALPRLRLLVATADPHQALGAEEDLAIVQSMAQAHPDLLHVEALRQATPGQLERTLRNGHFDVFVFLGDGHVMRERSKAGGLRQALQLVREAPPDDGLMSRNKLGEMLWRAGVRLAVLNGSDSDWVARSFAKHIPAAIGFREALRRETRAIVVPALLRALIAGLPLDLAVTAVRQEIDHIDPGSGQWCRLIFYMQAPDGHFLLQAREAAVSDRPPVAEAPNRAVAKLMRLRAVYQSNLDSVAQAERLRAEPADSPQMADLRRKVAELDQQIVQASRDGDGSP